MQKIRIQLVTMHLDKGVLYFPGLGIAWGVLIDRLSSARLIRRNQLAIILLVSAIGRAINNIFNPEENDAYVSHYPPSYGMREAAVPKHIETL